MFRLCRSYECALMTVLGTFWACGGGSAGDGKGNTAGQDAGNLQATGGQTSSGSEVGGDVSTGGTSPAGGTDTNTSGGSESVGGTSAALAGSSNCSTGAETCACYGNDTCNSGLTCVSHVCVNAGTGGSTGAPGVGGTGPGVGGTVGTGGVSTSGGATGAGGSAITGGKASVGGSAVTGGASSVGGSSDGGSTSSSCAEPSLYCPCSTLGALNCLGHAQKVQLLCDGTRWIANGTCSSTQVCDTSAGANQGLCATPVSQCVGRQSSESFCTGTTKYTCGPDLLNITSTTCPYLCLQGACTGVCTPNTTGCLANQTATCDQTGHWQPVSTCVHDCALGACCGAATPDACGSSCVDLQTNSANCGTCGNACTGGKTCQAGVCSCPANQTDCGTCVNLQTNKANCSECGNACPGTQTCSGGVCGMFNLLANGDFSAGTTNWSLSSYSGASIAMSGDALCISFTGYGYGTLGWGNSTLFAPLSAGTSYTFSYTAWVATGTMYTFTAKVGHSVSPYTTDYSTSADVLTSTPTQYVHTFSQLTADTGAGIGFTLQANTSTAMVCFQNVTLLPNG